MGGHLLLPGLLLLLPPISGWTISNCLVTEGSRLHLVSRFSLCRLDSSLPLLAACSRVSNVTKALEAVPQGVEGLCLSGSPSVLPTDAFSRFPGLKALGLNLHLTQIQPGAFRGLGQLQRLSFIRLPVKDLFLPPDALGNLSSLQSLAFSGFCLNGSSDVRLPPNLRRLSITLSCLENVGQLADIFPDLVLGSSSGDAWTLEMLDLTSNNRLKVASPGALQGLKLGTLKLDHTKMKAAAVMGLGLQRLDALSVTYTDTAELPAETVAHFELQELNLGLGWTRIEHIALEALASCQSLKSLSLQGSGLMDLPPGLLAALPRLQRLNLSGNKLRSAVLCPNETGAVSGLRALDLSSNELQSLAPATFSCLSHLRELLLQKNQLVWLGGQVFQGLRRLEMLDLSNNPLEALGEGWLAPLPALTTLNLLKTHIVPSPAWDFLGPESLQDLRLPLPSGPSGAALSLPTRLTSLELQAVPGGELWELASPVFPALQTLTLNGWGLQLGTQNVTKIFPALRQLSLFGSSLDGLCSHDTPSFFLWQLPRLQYLRVQGDGHGPKPCCVTGLPSLQELKLQRLRSRAQPRRLQLEELVGELPSLQVLHVSDTGLETLSAVTFRGLGSLQVLVLDWEEGLVLDGSLQQHSPQMPRYVYVLTSSLACQCANAWVQPWLERSPRTYVHIASTQLCQPEAGVHPKRPLFPFLRSHCPRTLELGLFLGSSALLLLLISLPLLQEARNSWLRYLQALFRAWLQDLRGRKGEGKRFLYDVFVSHCRQDQAWVVQELLPALEGRRGLRLCLPERDFEPGKDVADNVVESMANSQVTLCVLSCRALHTPRCRLELRLATSLLLAAPRPPLLLLVFLERVSRHQLPRYHRLAWLLRRGDYCLWPEEEERKDGFWAWLGGRLEQARLG
ncbi:toll-like receptor 12 [Eptesicus fuscus]|uniref:toll-like receptor 12 n=1 Tax=Eptesicus fuscus TaxID=29078 RepID=UPI002404675C|nr:toll-like receptor 12 [Eptesicus fuscus]